jgi:hypothetical protein
MLSLFLPSYLIFDSPPFFSQSVFPNFLLDLRTALYISSDFDKGPGAEVTRVIKKSVSFFGDGGAYQVQWRYRHCKTIHLDAINRAITDISTEAHSAVDTFVSCRRRLFPPVFVLVFVSPRNVVDVLPVQQGLDAGHYQSQRDQRRICCSWRAV